MFYFHLFRWWVVRPQFTCVYLRNTIPHLSYSSLSSPSFICLPRFSFFISHTSCFSATLSFYFSRPDWVLVQTFNPQFSILFFEGSWDRKSYEYSSVPTGFKECHTWLTLSLAFHLHWNVCVRRVSALLRTFYIHEMCALQTHTGTVGPKIWQH